ncbi:hypothetical protein VB711_25725 [Cronbergia sp. UHCC 0137]|nr:hypothetical protein [Cronbergia sp. UHCC 0137]MEA5621208.1 hypothetical protein [Cronbergia sp. UHCC 0137]
MTDDIKRSKGKFDYLAETRDWSSAATQVPITTIVPMLTAISDTFGELR